MKTATVLVALGVSAPLFAAERMYCPYSDTDTDGDGWGWVDNTSCVVLPAIPGTPVCSAPEFDSDGDGWGWEFSSTCLVDSFSGQVGSPVPVNMIGVDAPDYLRYGAVASDGTMYFGKPALNTFAALDRDGNTIWQNDIDPANALNKIRLDKNENNLILHMAAGEIASYTTDGEFNWITESYELVRSVHIGTHSIVIHQSPWSDSGEILYDSSVVSIGYDGVVRWQYEPDNFINEVIVGNDDRVYVTVSTDDQFDEKVFVFDQ
jgi:hypothetical protein